MSLEPRRPERPPPMSDERAAHVFGALAEFGDAYPEMCEGDRRMYRDLCRVALTRIGDDAELDAMRIGHSVDEVLERVAPIDAVTQAQHSVAYALVRRLRSEGIRLRFRDGKLTAGPTRLITDEIRNDLKRVRRMSLLSAVVHYQDRESANGHTNGHAAPGLPKAQGKG